MSNGAGSTWKMLPCFAALQIAHGHLMNAIFGCDHFLRAAIYQDGDSHRFGQFGLTMPFSVSVSFLNAVLHVRFAVTKE